jgi:hypothetical protein
MRQCLILFVGLLAVESATDKGFPDYNPQVYPDSQIDFGLCRLIEPSLVCDPNALLNPVDGQDGEELKLINNLFCLGVIMLHEATQRILFNTKCVCDALTYGTCIHKTRGYPISVAVLFKVRGGKK